MKVWQNQKTPSSQNKKLIVLSKISQEILEINRVQDFARKREKNLYFSPIHKDTESIRMKLKMGNKRYLIVTQNKVKILLVKKI